ncbi:MAG: efflux RND transporter periplasmic adaptor subunit [bacterium]|nr:efflux RND transporter periplasmic adaptor subunit [bacterium]
MAERRGLFSKLPAVVRPKELTAVLLAIAVFLTGYYLIGRHRVHPPLTASVAGSGGFTVDGTLETDEVDISSKLPGRLSQVMVEEGDSVYAGQVVALLEADEIEAKCRQAEAGVRAAQVQVAQGGVAVDLERLKSGDQADQAAAGVKAARAALGMARAKLSALEKGARPQEIAQAAEGVAASQAAFDTADKTYRRVKGLSDEGVLSQQKADEAEMAYRSASAQLSAARARLDLVREGARTEEIEAAREQVNQAEAGLRAAQSSLKMARDASLMVKVRQKDVEAARQKVAASEGALMEAGAYRDQTRIISPISGIISRRMSRSGEIVAPGYSILSVSRDSGYWVDVYVDENKFAGRSKGERVKVEIPALGKTMPGRIVRIMPAADFAVRRATNEKGSYDIRALRVRIILDDNLKDLAVGLTARVHFG